MGTGLLPALGLAEMLPASQVVPWHVRNCEFERLTSVDAELRCGLVLPVVIRVLELVVVEFQ